MPARPAPPARRRGLAGPGLGLGRPRLGSGRPGLRAAHRLVPLLPRRGHLLPRGLLGLGGPCLRGLPRGHRLLLGGGLRRQRLGQPRLSLRRRSTRLPRTTLGPLGTALKPGPGLLARRDLRFQPGPQLGLILRSVLTGPGHLLLHGPAHPVQLRPSRLGRLPRPRRVLPASPARDSASATRDSAPAARDSAPRTASSRSCPAAATCSRAARASCSAAAFAASASPSRASASAAAARASRASPSARWRRRQNANPGRPGSPGCGRPATSFLTGPNHR